MARKHIKVSFVQGVIDSPTERFTPEECLELAARAEALDHKEWAAHWMDQALIEERNLQYKLAHSKPGILEVGV